MWGENNTLKSYAEIKGHSTGEAPSFSSVQFINFYIKLCHEMILVKPEWTLTPKTINVLKRSKKSDCGRNS
jgi:hypothetical protein